MERTAVATTNVAGHQDSEVNDRVLSLPNERGWRAFLVSWKLAVILAVACALGLAAIFAAANPFASTSVSERVSSSVGSSAVCVELAGRTERATAVYDEFIASVRNQRRYRTMVERAGRRVERATT